LIKVLGKLHHQPPISSSPLSELLDCFAMLDIWPKTCVQIVREKLDDDVPKIVNTHWKEIQPLRPHDIGEGRKTAAERQSVRRLIFSL
jgi:hypothetical protein